MNQSDIDLINKKIVFCSLLLQEFAYRELLSSHLIKGQHKHTCSSKLKYIKNQLIQIQKASKTSREKMVQSIDMAIDQVGLMAYIVGTLALVPGSQIDFIEEEFSKICFRAINIHNKQLKDETREKTA